MIKIAIISNPSKLSGILTRWFAGSAAYHIAFVDTAAGKMYDQHLIFRRRLWPHYPDSTVQMYECPVDVTTADLERWLDTDEAWYGAADYMFFGIRKLFPNAKRSFKGSICSETIERILQSKGWQSPFENVPSPTDFEKVLLPC